MKRKTFLDSIAILITFITVISSFTCCSNLLSVGIKNNNSSIPDTESLTCAEGWYIWNDNINAPLYIYYESDGKVKRIGTKNDEILGEKFNIASQSFTYSLVSKSLSYEESPDILLDLPEWTRSFILKDFSITEDGKIDGFKLNKASEKESTYCDPCFELSEIGSSVTFNTSYFAYENDFYKEIETLKPLGLYVTCEDESLKDYITVSNNKTSDSINLVYSPLDYVNGEKLSNNLTFTSLKKDTSSKVFHLQVRNKERGEDTFMFDLYLKI